MIMLIVFNFFCLILGFIESKFRRQIEFTSEIIEYFLVLMAEYKDEKEDDYRAVYYRL